MRELLVTRVARVTSVNSLSCVLCSLDWAAAGWRLAESLPSSQHTAAAAGPSQPTTLTLTKPFEKTLKLNWMIAHLV